jgi:hypothetical protein
MGISCYLVYNCFVEEKMKFLKVRENLFVNMGLVTHIEFIEDGVASSAGISCVVLKFENDNKIVLWGDGIRIVQEFLNVPK